jgi:hypothetical protein
LHKKVPLDDVCYILPTSTPDERHGVACLRKPQIGVSRGAKIRPREAGEQSQFA